MRMAIPQLSKALLKASVTAWMSQSEIAVCLP
jgi:hypothetical protein